MTRPREILRVTSERLRDPSRLPAFRMTKNGTSGVEWLLSAFQPFGDPLGEFGGDSVGESAAAAGEDDSAFFCFDQTELDQFARFRRARSNEFR